MVVRDNVGVAVLGFVHLQVGVLPRELLTGVNRLQHTSVTTQAKGQSKRNKLKQSISMAVYARVTLTPKRLNTGKQRTKEIKR